MNDYVRIFQLKKIQFRLSDFYLHLFFFLIILQFPSFSYEIFFIPLIHMKCLLSFGVPLARIRQDLHFFTLLLIKNYLSNRSWKLSMPPLLPFSRVVSVTLPRKLQKWYFGNISVSTGPILLILELDLSYLINFQGK